jgi:Protein of unknown function (DUF1302)
MWRRRANHLTLLCLISLSATAVVFESGNPNAWADTNGQESWYSQFGRSVFTGSNAPFFDTTASPDWRSGLSISGFISNTSGTWVNSDSLTNFGRAAGEHHNANSLSVERNWMQVDTNYLLDGNNEFFLRFWGVYEPSYPWEDHSLLGPSGKFDRAAPDFYNRYDVRDAFWKNTTGPLTLFLGRQIVTWGESISFRVGDVINPQDLSWNFGFANLEQSRLPLWMAHPIVGLPAIGVFGSNFIEGVWAPPWQPLYTSVDYPDGRYDGQHQVAGAVNLAPPGGGRFDVYPYPFTVPAITPPGQQAAFPQISGSANPPETFRLPSDRLSNSMEGVRLHTLVDNAEVTLLYWHGHQLNDTIFVTGTPATGQGLQHRYPELNDIGVTANRPIYFDDKTLSQIPLVLRMEAVWQDRTPFNTISLARPSAVTYSSTLNSLVALDIDNLAAPWLTRSGTLTTNFEWNNYTILSPNKDLVYGGYAERRRHNEESLLISANTSWWWGAIVANPSAIYNPDGETWELFPSLTLTPPWTDKYLLTLQYIGILGNDKYSAYAGGNFKGKSLLLLRFQYNFTLVRGRS